MSPTHASWLCVSQPAKLDEKQRQQVEHIRKEDRDLATAYHLSQAFVSMLSERHDRNLDEWLGQAKHSGILEIVQDAAPAGGPGTSPSCSSILKRSK